MLYCISSTTINVDKVTTVSASKGILGHVDTTNRRYVALHIQLLTIILTTRAPITSKIRADSLKSSCIALQLLVWI